MWLATDIMYIMYVHNADGHWFWTLKDNEQLVLLEAMGYVCYNNTPVVLFLWLCLSLDVGGLQVSKRMCRHALNLSG